MRDFLKIFLASALGTFASLVALIAFIGLGAGSLVVYLLASTSTDVEPEVEDKSILVYDLSLEILDSVPPSGPGIVLEETLVGASNRAISLRAALDSIAQAAEDDSIVGLYLHGNTSEGFATLKELRQALETFKQSGKPILAYDLAWSERDYYLTSVADTLVLNAAGILEFNGFRAETQFLAGALQKYGIGVQVLRAGRYKSAVEPFIRTESSPEDREQTQALLADLWQEILKTTAESRESTPEELQQLADQGGLLMAQDALDAGLVDRVSYFDEVLTDLQDLTDTEPDDGDAFPQISLSAYSRLVNQRLASKAKGDTIAIVYADGEIISGQGSPGIIGSATLTKALRKVRLDDDVKAVVLRVNSPGGGASASEVITREVELTSEVKPVVVSMGDFAASGGYMISTQADKIFASPGTITGSIGVFGLILNLKEVANDNGVTWDVIKTAEYADIDTISRPQTSKELALQQAVVDDLYDRFITMVAESRQIAREKVDDIAQGRVWTGVDAKEIGLVDELGGLNDAVSAAAEQAELEQWRIEEYPKPRTLEEQIFENLFGQLISHLPMGADPLTQEFQRLREELAVIQLLTDPRGLYTRLSFTTEIE
ncbi:MAG: signal peptide peptidase SppA [Leptolyngbyaceae cyanobacterium MO_188.B28]|nr:signal peptide peptidase SppA [Leptolyngbyaceae cyanobacterium MO_188.B28]